MKKRIIFLIALLAGAQSLSATIWRVNNNAGVSHDFTTIQDAVDAASPGDTIHVEGSITPYDADVYVNKQKLTIIGPGFQLASNVETQHLKPSAKMRNIHFTADSCMIAGMEQLEPTAGVTLNNTQAGIGVPITAWSGYRLFINASAIRVINCKLNMVTIENDQPLESITISKCWFCPGMIRTNVDQQVLSLSILNNFFRNDFNNAGFVVIDLHPNVVASIGNNTFYGGFQVNAPQNCQIYNNVFFATLNRVTTALTVNGPNNQYNGNIYNIENLGGMVNGVNYNVYNGTSTTEATAPNWFAASGGIAIYDKYFLTGTVSPIRTAATAMGITELGMFCGLSPYVLSGLTNIPAVYEIIMPSEVSSDGFEVTVKVKAH